MSKKLTDPRRSGHQGLSIVCHPQLQWAELMAHHLQLDLGQWCSKLASDWWFHMLLHSSGSACHQTDLRRSPSCHGRPKEMNYDGATSVQSFCMMQYLLRFVWNTILLLHLRPTVSFSIMQYLTIPLKNLKLDYNDSFTVRRHKTSVDRHLPPKESSDDLLLQWAV